MVPSRYGLISMTFLTVCEAAMPTSQCILSWHVGRTDVSAGRGTRVDADHDAVLELEGQRGGAVRHLDAKVAAAGYGHLVERRVLLQEVQRLRRGISHGLIELSFGYVKLSGMFTPIRCYPAYT